MPSRFLLTYAVTNILINEIRDAFNLDKELFYTDGNIQSRINIPKVLDGWNRTIRDYPSIIIPSVTGSTKRMGIGDAATVPYFGVSATEAVEHATNTYRKFYISDIMQAGIIIEASFNGDPKTSPRSWEVPVQEEEVNNVIKKFIELEGSAIGPNETYPRTDFSFISRTPTGEQYGGFFDLRPDIYVVTLSPIEREIITDKLWSFLWFSKKRELLYKGVCILDVNLSGMTQEDYGVDKIYVGRMSISCQTEFRQLIYYLNTVEGIKVEGEAVLPSVI